MGTASVSDSANALSGFGIRCAVGESAIIYRDGGDVTDFLFVLSGGSGTRLWPLSRRLRPKQFLRLGCGKNLLEKTLERLCPVLGTDRRLGVIAPVCFEPYMEKFASRGVDLFVREPQARGTASAMLLAALRLRSYRPDDDPVVAFVPSDHVIGDEEAFRSVLLKATSYAAQVDSLVAVGVTPAWPEIGYGYIVAGEEVSAPDVVKVHEFREKPSLEDATALIASGNAWWNTGIYVSRLSVFLREFQLFASELWDAVHGFVSGVRQYAEVDTISFDHAIAEKVETLHMVKGDFAWSDVGNLESFMGAMSGDACRTKIINFNGDKNLAHAGHKSGVFCGVENVCVVETEDVTLVLNRDQVNSVKALVETLGKDREKVRLL